MFGVNITWIYVHISLLDDIYLESDELFHGVLTTSDPAVILDPNETAVVIQDDDSTLIYASHVILQVLMCSHTDTV